MLVESRCQPSRPVMCDCLLVKYDELDCDNNVAAEPFVFMMIWSVFMFVGLYLIVQTYEE